MGVSGITKLILIAMKFLQGVSEKFVDREKEKGKNRGIIAPL
jgi:hypothetical protein